MFVTLVVEGTSDLPVARRVAQAAGVEPAVAYSRGGKAAIDIKLAAYNKAAARQAWFVLRDLDHDELCAGTLVGNLLPQPAAGMCFRLAVREVEAWLLADRDRIAAYLGVSPARVPRDPDSLDDPKKTLVDLGRRSRRRDVRHDMVPPDGSTARVGPGYRARVTEFSSSVWRPDVAATASPSLFRCLAALKRLKGRSFPTRSR